MQFDINGELNPGIWFYFDDADESKGKVCLRVCAGDDLRAIRKLTTEQKVEFRRGQRIEYDKKKVPEEEESALLWDFCIVDWAGVLDTNSKPIPCTKENKARLMGKSPTFAKFIGEKLGEIVDIQDEETQVLEKN